MPQSLANVLVHIVFSTKDRQPCLADATLRAELHSYLAGISMNLDCPAIIVGGIEDHVHILARQARTMTLAHWIQELKRGSSIWIKKREQILSKFQWQNGYGAFSVSQSQAERVERYVCDQAEHHRKTTFQEEFRRLLKRHKMEFDERYVWD